MKTIGTRSHIKLAATVVLFLTGSVRSVGTQALTITGKVIDSAGHPLRDATVMVYHAGVLNGYSTFCPSCYKDCGKHTKTDESGVYTISKLESGLWFDLLIVRDGYAPEILQLKDVSTGTAPTATLKARPSILGVTSHALKGHVVDGQGNAVRDAVITPWGVDTEEGSIFGTIPGLVALAVTNQNGDFELVYEKSAKRVLITVEARTLALKFATLVAGPRRQTIELFRGATVKGRLVQEGKPVGDAEIGLISQRRGGFGPALRIVGDPYPEIRVGAQRDGTFVISDVPNRVHWFVYAKMESVAPRGASETRACLTATPGGIVDVGDIQLRPGYRLQGKVILSDAKSLPDGMRVMITSHYVWDSQTALLDKDGRFKFVSLPKGEYSISPAVRGYSLPGHDREIQTSVERDMDDFVISLSAEQPSASKQPH
jgi:hypothetical protein